MKPLFSVTRKDFDMQFMRAGGNGGQKQNKTSSACRIVHRASGAVGESREERQQHQNRKIAFERCVQSKTFQAWLKATAAAVEQGHRDLEKKIDGMMAPSNLRIEVCGLEADHAGDHDWEAST